MVRRLVLIILVVVSKFTWFNLISQPQKIINFEVWSESMRYKKLPCSMYSAHVLYYYVLLVPVELYRLQKFVSKFISQLQELVHVLGTFNI